MAYTTDGRFKTDLNGTVIQIATGYPLEPQITIPNDADSIIITETGLIEVLEPGNPNYQQMGQLIRVTFPNWQGLDPINDNLYAETLISGSAIQDLPQVESSVAGWSKEENTQTITFSGSDLVYDQLNLSIQGQGYFQLQNTDGTIDYTRDGAFTLNQNGQVIHKATGDILLPQITIPQNAIFAGISTEGYVSVVINGSTEQIGQIQLAGFMNPSGLDSTTIGGGIYLPTIASGDPIIDLPGRQDMGLLIHHFFITVTVTDASGCKGNSTVEFIQIPYPLTPNCGTVSITPAGPIVIGKGQSITFDAGSGYSSYSWQTKGTPKSVHFSITDGQVAERSDFVMTDGYLALRMDDGTTAYTNDGRFTVDVNGMVIHIATGLPLEPQITIPNNSDSIIITETGMVEVTMPGNSNYTNLGNLMKYSFPNWQGLDTLGENLYRETMISGSPIQSMPEVESPYTGWSKEENTQTITFSGSDLVYDQLNLAIQGAGYFQLQDPDGTTDYTRDGVFTINRDGLVIHKATGYGLLPQIYIPQMAKFAGISTEGYFTYVINGTTQQAGQIQLAQFLNPLSLDSTTLGGGLYLPTAESGDAIVGLPGQQGMGLLVHKFLITVTTISPNGCKGTSTVEFIQTPYPMTPNCATVSITPAGPISIGKEQSITFDAGSGFTSYSWQTNGTPKSVHFSIADGQVAEKSDFVMTDGYLALRKDDGTLVYTNDGRFTVDVNGNVVHTLTGYPLEQQITIPNNADSIIITETGLVEVVQPGYSVYTQLGQIMKINFPNWQGLDTLGENLYVETMASGQAIQSQPLAESSYTVWSKEENTQTITFSGSDLVYDQLNFAIQGAGYFQLQNPDGTTYYTRDGAFTLNQNGQVVQKSSGYILLPQLTIPQNAKFASISTEGNVQVTTVDGSTMNIGQIQLAQFNNPLGLDSTTLGGGLFIPTVESGDAIVGLPGQQGMGLLVHKFFITVTAISPNGCKGTSTVEFIQTPFPQTPDCATVSITPAGPITVGKGQSITFNADNGFVSYSWQTNGTPKSVHFSITNGQVAEKSNFVMTDGYLGLRKDDGTQAYTNDGRFTTDANGNVVHLATGYLLDPSITIPTDADSIIINETGNIEVLEHGNSTYTNAGQINKVTFTNWKGLDTLGENLYQTSIYSGNPITSIPQIESIYTGWSKEENTQSITFSGSGLMYDQLDLAIQGDGYFQLQNTDGTTDYTRDGAFTINQMGQVVHKSSGFLLTPQITIPQDAKFANISTDGYIQVTANGSTMQIGQIQIARFMNPSGLDTTTIGGGIYIATNESGNPQTASPGQAGTGLLYHKFFITVTVMSSNGCKGTSKVEFIQLPYPKADYCATASITPAGPITLCQGQSITFNGGSGDSLYSWLTHGTQKTIHFSISGIPTHSDLVITSGYLPIQNSSTGENFYTSDGKFSIDANGVIINEITGFPLLMSTTPYGPIQTVTIPPNTDSILVTESGEMDVLTHGSTTYTQIAQVMTANFINWLGLREMGENLYEETMVSGAAIIQAPEHNVDFNGWWKEVNTQSVTFSGSNLLNDQLDLTIIGNGYFQLQDPSGITLYTRDGVFAINQNGQIIHKASGYLLLPQLTIPWNARFAMISPDGIVKIVQDNSGVLDTIQTGQIQLACFANPSGLQPTINPDIYEETSTSGQAIISTPGQGCAGSLIHNFKLFLTITQANGCEGIDSVTIIQYLSPAAPIISLNGPASFCNGQSVTLDAGGDANSNDYPDYLWNTSESSKQITVLNSGQYYVSVKNSFGCSTTSDTVSTHVFKATITPSGSVNICSGNHVTLTADPAQSYLWSTGDTTQSIIVSETNDYAVTVNANGCTLSKDTVVTVYPLPIAEAGNDTTIYNGDGITIGGEPTGGYTYSWSPVAGLSDAASANPLAQPATSTKYFVTVTDQTSGCSAVDSINITVIPNPNCTTSVAITPAGPITLCEGQCVNFDAGSGDSLYSWQTYGTPKSISFSINNIPTVVNLSLTDGFLPLQNPATGETVYTTDGRFTIDPGTSEIMHVATGYPLLLAGPSGMTPLQIVSIPAGTVSLLVTETGLVQAYDGSNYTTIGQIYKVMFMNWKVLDKITADLYKENAGSGAPVYTIPEQYTNFNGWWKEQNTQAVEFCGSNLLFDQLNMTIAGNGYFQLQQQDGSYAYTRDGVFTINQNGQIIHKSSGDLLMPQIVFPFNTKFAIITPDGIVKAISDNSGVLDTTVTGQIQLACFNNPAGLEDIGSNLFLASVDSGEPTISLPGGDCAGSLVHHYSMYVTVVDYNGCRGIDSVEITVNPSPKAPVITSFSGSSSFCMGSTITLDGGGYDSGAEYPFYLWNNGNSTRQISVDTSGIFYVTVKNSFGCVAHSDTMRTHVFVAGITPTGTVSICQGSQLTITAATAESYLWTTGETTQSIVVSTSGVYNVMETFNNNACSIISNNDTIIVNPLPSVRITPSGDTTFCQGGSVTLDAGTGFITYLWSNGDATQMISPNASGDYTVTVSDAHGCSASRDMIITVNPLPYTEAGNDTIITLGDAIHIGSNPIAGYSYSWSPTIGLSDPTIANPIATIPSSTKYYVTVTDQVTGCTNVDSIFVINAVTAGEIGTAQAICNGDTPSMLTSIADAIGLGIISYQWQTDASGAFTTIAGETTNSYQPPSLTANTNYRRRSVSVYNGDTTYSAYTTPVLITVRAFWTGITSSEWTDATNWCNTNPTDSTDAIIPAGTPYAPHVTSGPLAPASCRNLTIESGAVVTIEQGKALTVNGIASLNSPECLVLLSDSAGTATFVDNGIVGNGTAHVEKYLTTDRWWYIGSPLTTISGFDAFGELSAVPSTGTRAFYYYEPDPDSAFYIPLTDTNTLKPFQGYAFKEFGPSALTAEFTGNLNSGNIGIENLTRTPGAKAGYNLVCNPYPSPINWGCENAPATGLTMNHLDPTIQFREEGTYGTWNWMGDGTGVNGGTQFIPAMQGFWVKVSYGDTLGGFELTNKTRLQSAQSFHKTATAHANVFRFQISRDNMIDESAVTFYPNALTSYENYDSYKMFTDIVAYPQLYSLTSNKTKVAINGQPDLVAGTERIVPIGFLTNVADTFTIRATNVGDFDPDVNVYLEDKQQHIIQYLRQINSYSFSSSAVNDTSRFKLHFGIMLTSDPTVPVSDPVNIYSFENSVYVYTPTTSDDEISIYDMLGKLAMTQKSIMGLNRLELNAVTGIYVVKVQTKDRMITNRVMIGR